MTNGRTNVRNSKSPAGGAHARKQPDHPARSRRKGTTPGMRSKDPGGDKTKPANKSRTAKTAKTAKLAKTSSQPPSPASKRLPLYTEARTEAAPKAASCTSCGLCCSYVAIEVDTPKTVKQATMLLWYVYHQGVSLYVNDDDWMVQFDTTCIHLQPDYRCGVYETRPHICREFSEQDCEINTGDDGRTFYTASEFMEHLALKHPRVHSVVKKSFAPPAESPRTRLAPFEHRFQAVMSRRSALGV